MLILTRKLGERITIGEEIVVTILEIHGRQVKIGIEAPREMAVHREEVFLKIQDANIRAASPDPDAFGILVETLKKSSDTVDKKAGRKAIAD